MTAPEPANFRNSQFDELKIFVGIADETTPISERTIQQLSDFVGCGGMTASGCRLFIDALVKATEERLTRGVTHSALDLLGLASEAITCTNFHFSSSFVESDYNLAQADDRVHCERAAQALGLRIIRDMIKSDADITVKVLKILEPVFAAFDTQMAQTLSEPRPWYLAELKRPDDEL
jgi:hypothetical protein